MNLILIILKYVGTAISGAAGIWGTVSETRDKNTGRLSRWGKWALGLAVAGFVVALGSQIAEQVIANDDKKEAKQTAQENEKRLQNQLDLAQQQLALARSSASAIESERTRFDRILVFLTFELPVNDSRIQRLVDEVIQLGAPYPTNGRGQRLGNDPAAFTVFRHPTGSGVFAIPANQKEMPGIGSLANCFAGLRSTTVNLDITKQPGSSERPNPSDLSARGSYSTNDATIYYDTKYPPPLTIKLQGFEFDAKDWTSNGKVIGIHDLSGAKLTLHVSWQLGANKELAPVISPLRLVSATLVFGKFSCRVKNFSAFPIRLPGRLPDGRNFENSLATRYECTLPDADAILSGKAW